MKTKYLLVLCIILLFNVFLIQFARSKSFSKNNMWLTTPYPKSEICSRQGSIISLPRSEDLTGYKSCFQQLAQVRRTTAHSQRTIQAAKERNFNLVTYHNVTTKDGYMLTVFRVSGYKNEKPRPRKPAVLIVHPMASSSDIWFYLPGNKSIVNILVNAGYEVWLPNIRGTTYSLGHVTLNATYDLAYWNFSMHEIGIYDLPAIINLMLKETGSEKIFYIGYSLSTNYDAVARSEIPELNEKFYASFWMGATIVTGLQHSATRPLTYLLGNGHASEFLKQSINILSGGRMGAIFDDGRGQILLFRFCSSTPFTCGICGNLFSFFAGFDTTQVKYTDLARMIFIGNSFSFKMAAHLGENARVCRFQKYSYGEKENMRIYGQPYPPLYNLSNVRSPTYLYYGDNDLGTTPTDQRAIRDLLPPETVKGFFRVPWKYFNHFGFLYANDADTLVYDSIAKIIESYVNS